MQDRYPAQPAAEDARIRNMEAQAIVTDRNNLRTELKVTKQALESLKGERDQLKAAFNEWVEKSDWARADTAPGELGKHMADVIRMRFDQLKAESEALRKDAERYRWLRDSSESIHQFYLSTPIWFTGVKFSKENVDNTVDAAMSKEAGE